MIVARYDIGMTNTETYNKVQQAIVAIDPALKWSIIRPTLDIMEIVGDEEFDTQDELIAYAIEVATAEHRAYLANLV